MKATKYLRCIVCDGKLRKMDVRNADIFGCEFISSRAIKCSKCGKNHSVKYGTDENDFLIYGLE